MKQKEIKKLNKGITLIALVITIIVLLILAGVSIAMLTGENGILSQAQKAGEQTDIGKEKEDISLAYNGARAENNGGDVDADDLNRNFGYSNTEAEAEGSNPITVTFKESGRQYTIDENGVISGPTEANIVASIKIEGEKSEGTPPMPSSDFSYVTGTVDDGYVIEDANRNQYVWVPVDKNQKIKVNVTSKEDITSITLTDPYGDTILEQTNIGTTYTNNEIEPTINGPYVLKVATANEEKTTILGVHSLYAQDTFRDWELLLENDSIEEAIELQVKQALEEIEKQASEAGYDNVEDFANAMLESQGQPTLEEMGYSSVREFLEEMCYQELYYLEMKEDYSDPEDYTASVNENGGFYIGRYEASYENGKPASKTSEKINGSDNTVTENGMLWNNISQTDALSKAKGLYTSGEFTSSLLTGAAWDRTLGWLEETEAVTSFEIVGDSKNWGNYYDDSFSGTDDLINTGSKSETEKNHIFDLAGNVDEWTTEASSSAGRFYRGGSFNDTGSGIPCSGRSGNSPGTTVSSIGFRLALYL